MTLKIKRIYNIENVQLIINISLLEKSDTVAMLISVISVCPPWYKTVIAR